MEITRTTEAIRADCIIHGVIERHPQTIIVFARHGLQCVGCYIAPFHTIDDSAREHAVPVETLLDDLNHTLTAMDVESTEAAL